MPNISIHTSHAHSHDITPFPNIFYANLSETATEVADSIARKYISKRAATGSFTIEDAVAKIWRTFRTLTESSTIVIDSSPVVNLVLGRSASASLTVDATVARARDAFRSVLESLTVDSSVLTSVGTVIRNIAESIGIVDLVTSIKNAAVEIDIPESVTVNAVVAKSQSLVRSMLESIIVMATHLDIDVPDQQFFQRIIHESIIISTGLHIRTCWLSMNKGPAPVIIKKIGRFFTMLPQHSAKPYTYRFKFIKYNPKNDEEV